MLRAVSHHSQLGTMPTFHAVPFNLQIGAGGEQQEQVQQAALGFAILADVSEGAASGGEQGSESEAEQASLGSSPLRPDSGAFALLVGEGSGLEEQEEQEQEELADEMDLEDGGCEAAADSEAEGAGAVLRLEQQSRAADAASGASFSFGGVACQPGQSLFAFATSPPAAPAAAAATSPVLSPAQLQAGARLFGFTTAAVPTRRPSSPRPELPPGARASVVRLADLVPAASAGGGGESDDDTFYSAVPSRQASAALTAYASARSLRWAYWATARQLSSVCLFVCLYQDGMVSGQLRLAADLRSSSATDPP